ncbi:MAG: carboxypeptidase regulatory-like domain-containing protein [Proteobacteria bacterium]|nr:carboxypeptidase regulatory-like domain-containing protein [Pseudomonadota bacterium]MCP4919752.1 carboxypeptidase regulatory-like domain-containing protein [Pseudomonadota bacterium]
MLFLLACQGPGDPAPPPDLTQRLGPNEVLAGVVTDESALFAGVSAEGRAGDVKIYNDRVQFVIQGLRPGHYYMDHPGMVVDADVVRPGGHLGRDLVDDWGTMAGVGRMLEATTVHVVDDGRLSGRAVVRIEGDETPMRILVGATESEGIVPDFGLHIRTDYVLEPGSSFLEVHTTVTATDGDATFAAGDLLQGSLDVGKPWTPGSGRDQPGTGTYEWMGFTSNAGDVATGVFALPGEELNLDAAASLVSSLAEMVVAFGPSQTLAEGESVSWKRLYGVGNDMGELSTAWLELGGTTDTVSGTVTADDGPVAGAYVAVLADGEPYTTARTDADGNYEIGVPAGASTEVVVAGTGVGHSADHAPGWASYSAYAAETVRTDVLAALDGGAESLPPAAGRGVSEDGATLGTPGYVTITADQDTFEVQLTGTVDAIDEDLFPGRFKGTAATGWARGGDITLAVAPGTYGVLAHKGMRYEIAQDTVTVTAGETVTVEVELPAAYTLSDHVLGDPHQHAAPSQDGECPMEDRIAISAARGLQVHFGTDHDHSADYRPLLGAMGLDGELASVVASEISPVTRGHVNAYPLVPVDREQNGGVWVWYEHLVQSTQEQFDLMAEQHPDAIFQLNHPMDSGVGEMANWAPGTIGRPDRFTEDFQAIEVLNSGSYSDYLPFWMDLELRGLRSTPTGTSDTHGHTSGDLGMSSTFFVSPGGFSGWSDDVLVDNIQSGSTVVTRGPFLETSIVPGSTLGGGESLEVTALSPNWIQVDRLVLYMDGERIEEVEGTTATFSLDADADAHFVVMAEGDAPMSPVSNNLPWAMTGAYYVDLDGDGWEPPLPALDYGQ